MTTAFSSGPSPFFSAVDYRFYAFGEADSFFPPRQRTTTAFPLVNFFFCFFSAETSHFHRLLGGVFSLYLFSEHHSKVSFSPPSPSFLPEKIFSGFIFSVNFFTFWCLTFLRSPLVFFSRLKSLFCPVSCSFSIRAKLTIFLCFIPPFRRC